MGSINLYKIDSTKLQMFLKTLSKKMLNNGTIDIIKENETFGITLFTSDNQSSKELAWNWVLKEFNQPEINYVTTPKAVMLIEKEDETTYAITFGQAFFMVDAYCDKDFGFNFARKIEFKEIKTTTLTSPNLRRNKIVNTYINYTELDFDSGESFAKLKAKASFPDGFSLFKPALEIGNSIRFSTHDDSLENIVNSIKYIENIIKTVADKHKIPVFSKITDSEYIEHLNLGLSKAVEMNTKIHISELDIVGATEVFNHNDSEFVLKYLKKKKSVMSLSVEELKGFCNENNWNYENVVLNISVVSYYNGESVVTKSVRDMIDYTDDVERCMLSNGKWYKYNDDYLSYLKDSLSEILVEYHSEYDFTSIIHNSFINDKFVTEKFLPEYAGKSVTEIKKALKNKYYAERAFNLLRAENDGFQLFDREAQFIGTTKVEIMDLYKNNTMFAVKFGNSSGKLCYVVDQSLSSLKLYKQKLLPDMPSIDTVCIWIILERKKHIEDNAGKTDINLLDMLMLKNKLDQWKKEVRLQGYRPLIYINYRTT
ncbi:MAG: TIGR04141 family sporadically distributed protein [Candidatus Galacturonibacter soehngenii]|nr:TIGR04141 family sporadically distributed protein [Candidatus Galacturonibacter soehngenii]